MNGWIGIVGTLAGVVLGGLITWLLSRDQRAHEERKEKRQLLLSKYEEIHRLLGKLHACIGQLNLQVVVESVSERKFDPKQIRTEMPISELRMLIQFYVPELISSFEYLDKQTKFTYENVIQFILNENKSSGFKTEAVATAQETNKVIHQTIDDMKSELARLAGKLLESA